ncbi:amidohydrolase family protein [Nocardiopsis sp. NPDC050513]|uniref:amidohydrolase family protein n=1 Tax=Nocardiopsis sp. NPDC050513 TaxID=3364338 RepID=UPI00378C0FA9
MLVVDTHQHFWPGSEDRSRGALPDNRDRPATPDELRPHLDRCRIGATVLVQTENRISHTRTLLRTAAREDFVAAVCGWLPLRDAAATREALGSLGDTSLLRAVRHVVGRPSDDGVDPDLSSPATVGALTAVAEHGLAFDVVCVTPEEIRQAAALADRVPHLVVVLDHLGRPPVGETDPEPWFSAVSAAARRSNVVVKVSAGGHLLSARPEWDADALGPYVEHVRAVFGAPRMMFASNWPVIRPVADYGAVFTGLSGLFSRWSAGERAAVLAGTACAVYGIGADGVRSLPGA